MQPAPGEQRFWGQIKSEGALLEDINAQLGNMR